MIDRHSENVFPVNELPKRLHSRPHISTCVRWHQRGVRGVKLETYLEGGKRYTSDEAVDRFFQRITAAARGENPTIRTPRKRQADIQRAERELADAGI